ncbi:hypothetical protein HGRIS_011056 [Hohenbuehelia grisea]|uniref:Uncharacterized protein n=1 Tax=Hohenbuehelia grisea TaxID=104357 RepID=A0ABR3IYY8_9AGAR
MSSQVKFLWVKAHGGFHPQNAIKGGEDTSGPNQNGPLYVARAPYKGGIHPGKSNAFFGCFIPYGDKEIEFKDGYEELTGPQDAITWIDASGRFSYDFVGDRVPFVAGHEENGTPLFIVQADLGSGRGVHCGKTSPGELALISYAGEQLMINNYRIMVLA